MRSEGGKAPWPAWPWRILEACEPLGEIPSAPQAHGMAITAHRGGESEIGRGSEAASRQINRQRHARA